MTRVVCLTWILSTGQHDLLPGLSGGGAEEHEECLGEGLEVVVAVDVGVVVLGNFAEHLNGKHVLKGSRLPSRQVATPGSLTCIPTTP